MLKNGTLGYLIKDGKILLGKKKYGGAKGKLNGFGGKIEESDASIFDALIREFKEETSLDIKDPVLKGEICFGEGDDLRVIYVFEISDYEGVPKESDEMSVDWYELEDVDLTQMWPNDQIWFNLLRIPFKFVMFWGGESIDDYSTKIEINLLKEINEESYKKFTRSSKRGNKDN